MKIAQIAPLWERVPPFRYGGVELVVALLTDELVRRGHEVTLFASGDSLTSGRLKSVHGQALRLDTNIKEPAHYEQMLLGEVYRHADEFDIIHSHIGGSALACSSLVKTPTLHTLHGVFTSDNEKLFRAFADQPYTSITNAQREPRLGLNYVRTVYNGICVADYPFQSVVGPTPYLAFVGRISPEKGPTQAIAVARATGYPLRMAGKVDAVDQAFYQEQIKPEIDGEQIQYLGEVSHEEKVQLLAGAVATLFPITWREPFGLVMIESMATGTPVLGMALGSVPEVIEDGKTGFVCQSLTEMIQNVPAAAALERQRCRDWVVNHFSISQMTDGYEAAYQQVLEPKTMAALS